MCVQGWKIGVGCVFVCVCVSVRGTVYAFVPCVFADERECVERFMRVFVTLPPITACKSTRIIRNKDDKGDMGVLV